MMNYTTSRFLTTATRGLVKNSQILGLANLQHINNKQLLFNSNTNNNNNEIENRFYSTRMTSKRMKASFFVQTTGDVFEKSDLPSFTSILGSPRSWFPAMKYIYTTLSSLTVTKTKLKSLLNVRFTKRGFLNDAKEMFTDLNKAIAKGDYEKAKDLTTLYYYSNLAKKTGLENRPKDIKSEWWVNDDLKATMLWCRAGQIKITPTETQFFTQICVEFSGKQNIVNTNKNTNQVVSKFENVEFKDRYIFERSLSSLPSNWKIISSMDEKQAIENSRPFL
ncbi:hypothetical protein CYY_010579 [Polysphondylium violaceum]|uniref:Tim44-like domain-containing protein n=1 Tax=Polysphondylium violaceum TaxID=133409 RepID=A0A8J4PR66_9MYCE|nr:hypothetical protein CYY_010579 [Polysphondylium violaceum]